MPLIPNTSNPLLDYVDPSSSADMTVDGIVVDKVYGFTGVLDTISNNSQTQYQDPTTNQINPTSQFGLPNNNIPTYWVSNVLDDVYNTGEVLSFQFNRITYINYVTFEILNVPCTWQLLQVNGTYSNINTGSLLYQGSITGDDSSWQTVEITLNGTYEFNTVTNLVLIISKSTTGTQYSVGIQNFLSKLVVQQYSDITVSGTQISSMTTQNLLGFVETYTPELYPYSNVTVSGNIGLYWKSSPQPVKDAVVFFINDLGSQQTVDRMYIDPLYTGSVMNIYYSNGTPYPNLLTPPSDSFETGIGNWNSGGETLTILSQSSVESLLGNYSLAITNTTGPYVIAEYSQNIPVTPGQTYTLLASFLAATTGETVNVFITWQSANGQIVGATSNYINDVVGSWTQLVVSGVAPSNAATASLLFYIYVSPGEVHYMDCVSFAPGTSTTWGPGTGTVDGSSNWTPVNGDFSLKRGMFRLPTINARYIKLEFTQLVAEVYDLPFDSINRLITVFPDWIDTYFTNLEQAIADNPNQSYYPLNTNAPPNVTYNTAPQVPSNYGLATSQLGGATFGGSTTQLAPPSSNLGTSNYGVNSNSYTVLDPTVSYKNLQDIANLGSIYSNAVGTTFINRRFFTYGPHVYKYVLINQTWHEAYFTGIKYLSFYCSEPTVENGDEEFLDYLYPTYTAKGVEQISPNTIVNSGTSTVTMISGIGGYTGYAGNYLITQNLKTTNQFGSFKFATLSSDWQSFLSEAQTLLYNANPTTLGITISGASYSVNLQNPNYGIYTLSGSTGTSSITTAWGGGDNLFLSSQANFVTSGWSGGPVVTGTNTVISGLNLLQIPILSTETWNAAYGNSPYGGEGYDASATFGTQIYKYDFLVTASGSGIVTIGVQYLSTLSGVSPVTYTQVDVISGSTNLNFLTQQPVNTNKINVILTSSGNITYSEAGMFQGYTAGWINPIVTSNMRVSAIARVFLPNTNTGTYTCKLFSNTGQLLAQKAVSNIPLQTWVDIEVPYILPSTSANQQLYVQLVQQYSGEAYEVALLGIFYNPISWQFSTDGGSTWYNITTGINDANTSINTPGLTQNLMIKGTILEDYSTISAIDIVPVYTQTPYYTSTVINYLSDPKVNELTYRVPVSQRPLFQLSTERLPLAYNITQLMHISQPFELDLN